LSDETSTPPGKFENDLRVKFCARYGSNPRIYRAPGRVNLIGEHTDYNDGFVMPAAIDYHVWVAIAPRNDRKLIIHSEDFGEDVAFDLDQTYAKARGHWSDYIRGVAAMLELAGHRLKGADLLVKGNVPIGAGLSSSAAIGVASGLAFSRNSNLILDSVQLAQTCRRAENEFVGARVGIMDPFISCCGQSGHALMLDCRSLQFKLLPIPPGVSLVICNTMVKHALAAGQYNIRRRECEEAVQLLSEVMQVQSLREIKMENLETCRRILPPTIYRRCQHVISENARVLATAELLERSDLGGAGKCMAESHLSLRDDYEVSCSELDLMVQLANQLDGVYGARMTGGGFGGCTINLVDEPHVPTFRRDIAARYERATGLIPQTIVSSAADGARELTA